LRVFVFLILAISSLLAEVRIVTLSPATNEIVFALGNGKDVVATTSYANYPNEAKKLPKVGGYGNVSIEKIASMRPTLVITEANGIEETQKLQKLGIRTLSIRIDSVKNIKEAITSIGKELGKQKEAVLLNNSINQKSKGLLSLKKSGKKMLMVFGNDIELSKNIYVAGSNLYFSELIALSGFENAVKKDKSIQPILNMEGIIACNPDVVVILFPYTKEKNITPSQIKNTWSKLPINAAKSSSIYVLDNDYVSIPSNRVTLFMDDLYNIAKDFGAKVR
jgi:iron complex transport system substrate-binding protein